MFVPCNGYNVPVLIHRPPVIKRSGAVIYAHGGGVVAGTAAMMTPFTQNYQNFKSLNKFPTNVNDYYCAVKSIKQNSNKLRVDGNRLVIAGQSGGGTLVFGSMVLMAQRDETNLVKLAMPQVPMIGDLVFGDMAAMTNEERMNAPLVRKMWLCIANNFEEDRHNPVFFPTKGFTGMRGAMMVHFFLISRYT